MATEEKLVNISKLIPGIINGMEPIRKPFGTELYLRETPAKMLKKAHSLLPDGITFIVYDAWRPLEAQIKYYEFYYNTFRKTHPEWSKSKVEKEAGKYAISPKELDRAGHLTGGAIDLELWKNGRRLPIMARKVPFKSAVRMDSSVPPNVRKTREILFNVMTQVGFVNYEEEYWHYSYGEAFWAKATGEKVKYGIT